MSGILLCPCVSLARSRNLCVSAGCNAPSCRRLALARGGAVRLPADMEPGANERLELRAAGCAFRPNARAASRAHEL